MINVKDSLRNLLRPFASKIVVSEGIAKGTEEAASLYWSGPSEHLAYLQQRFFSPGTVTINRVGRRPIYKFRNMLAGSESSLGAIVLNRRMATQISGPEDVILPLWVDTRVDLGSERCYAKSKSLAADLRSIRKNKLEWNISKSRRDLDTFYERFYLPTIKASHGRAALLADKAERLKLFDAGTLDLLQVRRGDEVIAAVTIDYRQNEPVLRDSGVLDGSFELKKCGVIAALNLFSMDYLTSKGYKSVGLGLSRSFLDDGVLTFKRKFRPVVRPGFDQCLLVKTGALSRVTRAILGASDCFTWQGHELHRTYFRGTSPETPDVSGSGNCSDWNFGIEQESILDISGDRIRLATGPQSLARVS